MNKIPMLLKNVLPEENLKELQTYALSLYVTDKTTYEPGFGRHQWAYWNNSDDPKLQMLKKYHDMLTPLAREYFKSDTLIPSWSLLSIYEGDQAKLWKHKDDNACQYHINLCVFQKTPWDFWADGECYTMEENDAVLMYGNDQEHWREEFPNPKTNLVCNAFMFYCEPDHWYFTEGPNYLYDVIRAKKDDESPKMM